MGGAWFLSSDGFQQATLALGAQVFWNTRFHLSASQALEILIQWFWDGAQEFVFLVRTSCDSYH